MDDLKNMEKIKTHLVIRHETVALAESVTSGHLQAAFSLAANAIEFFLGGITAYNLGQKYKHLNIDPIHIESCNCLSEKITAEMSLQVSKLFNSDWGISITGYASPVPELRIKKIFAYLQSVIRTGHRK